MRMVVRGVLVVAMCAAVGLAVEARIGSSDAALQFQLGTLLYEETRFYEAREAFRRAADTDDPALKMRARIGVVKTALLVGEFEDAQQEAASLRADSPGNPEAMAIHADALWSAGLFDEAESEFRDALAIAPGMSRGRHGLAKALASRSHLKEALDEVQAALGTAPRDGELHHTSGAILERMHRYEEAAVSYSNYVNLLPNKDKSDKALWAKAQIRFLQAFKDREANALDDNSRGRLHTVPFKLVNDKVIVKARVNGGRWVDFVLDTGSEQTTMSRQIGQAAGVVPITYTLSAGVGEVGLRGLQLARLDSFEVGTLKVHDVPVLIKNPALKGIPKREMESFSPMALGLSMTIDYATKMLTMGEHLTDDAADIKLPLRMHRLAMVRGLINAERPAYFVVDTGGEVISISRATADALRPGEKLGRRIALKVYGTSGWDRDAFLMQGVNLRFLDIEYNNFSVVVLNLRAPSVLLGFQLGGIVGHRFLSPYRVAMDLERSELRMTRASGEPLRTTAGGLSQFAQ
ncbi:MAG: aspartyl protease family protein [Acidobacteriota bacterium]